MIEVEWIWGLIGGLIIGCGGAVYLLGNGRIMGASGIIGGLVDGTGRNAWVERVSFIAALILAPALLIYFSGRPAETNLTDNWVLIVVAGLLVGVGTRVGNGCTSGHGVCGISRLSPRGIVATLVYIFAGAVMVVALRSMMGGL
ncbi:YeeE/YedE thiosulfate transporter family protein [uncultured Sulfitobacter sp.]|uniref:YeeE/YedE family protein n=1 Tax=uncultured Sulfitobacter sp. TaxID=191468 RepID=UPI0030DA16A0|tara:strand:+ start:24826 stop:25257 length:432 start_codon:yes stop_codon:yes gene_type:complete